MIGEAFIGNAMCTSIGRYVGARLVLTAMRELELRRARRARCTKCVGV